MLFLSLLVLYYFSPSILRQLTSHLWRVLCVSLYVSLSTAFTLHFTRTPPLLWSYPRSYQLPLNAFSWSSFYLSLGLSPHPQTPSPFSVEYFLLTHRYTNESMKRLVIILSCNLDLFDFFLFHFDYTIPQYQVFFLLIQANADVSKLEICVLWMGLVSAMPNTGSVIFFLFADSAKLLHFNLQILVPLKPVVHLMINKSSKFVSLFFSPAFILRLKTVDLFQFVIECFLYASCCDPHYFCLSFWVCYSGSGWTFFLAYLVLVT